MEICCVTNIEKIKFTGKKFKEKNIINIQVIPVVSKNFLHYLKEKNKTQEILRLAVKKNVARGPLAKTINKIKNLYG